MSGKNLYNQMIIIRMRKNDNFDSNDTFPMSFPNIFIDYPLGQMRTTDTKWKHWNLFKAVADPVELPSVLHHNDLLTAARGSSSHEMTMEFLMTP